MTIKTIKAIEQHINFLLDTYDMAVKDKNHEMAAKTIEVINYELAKIDENEIKIDSETLLN